LGKKSKGISNDTKLLGREKKKLRNFLLKKFLVFYLKMFWRNYSENLKSTRTFFPNKEKVEQIFEKVCFSVKKSILKKLFIPEGNLPKFFLSQQKGLQSSP